MLSKPEKTTRTIHPKVLEEIPLESALALLEVARDLRSGAIPPELFDMESYRGHNECGTTYCIAGWAVVKQGKKLTIKNLNDIVPAGFTNKLFYSHHPSDPQRAARAIERYIYDYDKHPWAERIDDE